jgi:hypothetical protein
VASFQTNATSAHFKQSIPDHSSFGNNTSFMTDTSASLSSKKKKKSKGGLWKGHYEQQGVHYDMAFKKFSAKKDGELKGKGRDEVGEFELKGRLFKDGGVDFKKQYKGRHTVEYSGRMSEEGGKITGEWSVAGMTGGFVIEVRILIVFSMGLSVQRVT